MKKRLASRTESEAAAKLAEIGLTVEQGELLLKCIEAWDEQQPAQERDLRAQLAVDFVAVLDTPELGPGNVTSVLDPVRTEIGPTLELEDEQARLEAQAVVLHRAALYFKTWRKPALMRMVKAAEKRKKNIDERSRMRLLILNEVKEAETKVRAKWPEGPVKGLVNEEIFRSLQSKGHKTSLSQIEKERARRRS